LHRLVIVRHRSVRIRVILLPEISSFRKFTKGFQVGRISGCPLLVDVQLRCYCGSNLASNVILYCNHVFNVVVVHVRPDVRTGYAVDQMGENPYPFPISSESASDQV
jgi:hypothetical protein